MEGRKTQQVARVYIIQLLIILNIDKRLKHNELKGMQGDYHWHSSEGGVNRQFNCCAALNLDLWANRSQFNSFRLKILSRLPLPLLIPQNVTQSIITLKTNNSVTSWMSKACVTSCEKFGIVILNNKSFSTCPWLVCQNLSAWLWMQLAHHLERLLSFVVDG